MEEEVKPNDPKRVLKKTKSSCSDDVAIAIYSLSKEERRRSYEESLKNFQRSNSRKGDPVYQSMSEKQESIQSHE